MARIIFALVVLAMVAMASATTCPAPFQRYTNCRYNCNSALGSGLNSACLSECTRRGVLPSNAAVYCLSIVDTICKEVQYTSTFDNAVLNSYTNRISSEVTSKVTLSGATATVSGTGQANAYGNPGDTTGTLLSITGNGQTIQTDGTSSSTGALTINSAAQVLPCPYTCPNGCATGTQTCLPVACPPTCQYGCTPGSSECLPAPVVTPPPTCPSYIPPSSCTSGCGHGTCRCRVVGNALSYSCA